MTSGTTPAADSAGELLKSWRVMFWGVLALSFALYLSSLGGHPVWDDNEILNLRGIGGGTVSGAITQPFLHGYFRPLVSLFLLFENTFFHGAPFGFHLVNCLLHVGGAAALMGLLLECFGSRRIAILGGFFFAIHPVLVSTISWIGGITDCLGALLVLLFCYTLVLWAKSGSTKWMILSAFCYLLSLFCKEQVIALIFLVPFAQYAFSSKRSSATSALITTVPFLICAAIFLVMWKTYFPGYPDINWSATQRIQTIGESISYYAIILFLPTGKWLQTYTLGSFANSAWTWTILGYAVAAGFVYLWAKTYRVDKVFGWLLAFFLLSIVPVINIIPPPSLVLAPYRAGIAVAPFVGLIAVVLIKFVPKNASYVAAGILSLWWLAMAATSISPWLDQEELFSTIAQADPTFLQAQENLAITQMSPNGDEPANPKAAAETLEHLLDELYGSKVWLLSEDNNRGAGVVFRQDAHVQQMVAANKGPMSAENWLSDVFVRLGEARAATGDLPRAKTAFLDALDIRHDNFSAVIALAQLAMAQGDKPVAKKYLQQAQQLKPGDPGIAQMLQSLGS